MKSLDLIARECGTDKSSEIHDYCRKYEKYIPFYREQNITILEIGVLNGESIRMWREYFPNAIIVGIDINPKCKVHEEEGVFIEVGSQFDGDFLQEVIEKHGPFDLIVDDGSHVNEHVIFSFEHLFPAVTSGGVYIVEDACTSYWDYWGGGLEREGTSVEYFKKMVDEVNFFGELTEDFKSAHARRDDLLLNQFKRKGYNYIGTQIESLNFLNAIVLITKR